MDNPATHTGALASHLQWCRRRYMVNSALHTQQLGAMSSGTQSEASTEEDPMIPFTDCALLAVEAYFV